MRIKFYNFPKAFSAELSDRVTVRFHHCPELSVVYIESDTEENRLLVRTLLKSAKRPTVVVSLDQDFALLSWELEIDQFVYLPNGLTTDAYRKINKAVKFALLKNDYYLQKISINSQDGLDSIRLKDIAYIVADGSYSKIITDKNEILVSKKLKYFQDTLCEIPNFYRFGRSFIVNVNNVTFVEGRVVKFDNDVTVTFPRTGDSFKRLKELLLWQND